MPDITDQILNQSPYHYADEFDDPNQRDELNRITARFINTEWQLGYRPHWDTDQLDECMLEIKQSLLDWVSAGLIAQWISRYRMWQKKFSSWRNFCIHGLGRDPWKIKKLIEHAEIMVDLARDGFDVLPQNQSQVEKLLSCAKKLGCLISEAWDTVVSILPEQLITADTIAESLGFPSMSVNKRMDRELANYLESVASEQGLTLNEMLRRDYGLDVKEDELEADEVEEVEPEAMAIWETDLAELVTEHDQEIWLLCTLIKLANFIKRSTSQFSWLRQVRCQV